MSWQLIRSIQQETDLRLIVPFGLTLRLGDVISVAEDGGFTLEGNSKSLLGLSVGKPRPGQPAINLTRLSGRSAKCTFRGAGTASTLFPELPSANAGFDISFATADSWLLALMGRVIESMDDINRFRQPILDAYENKVWRADWSLVTSVARVDKMTLLASRNSNTNLALTVGATVSTNTPLEAQLTSDVAIVKTNEEILHCISTEPMTAFCTGLRVQPRWLRSPEIKVLEDIEALPEINKLTDDKFWENVDDVPR